LDTPVADGTTAVTATVETLATAGTQGVSTAVRTTAAAENMTKAGVQATPCGRNNIDHSRVNINSRGNINSKGNMHIKGGQQGTRDASNSRYFCSSTDNQQRSMASNFENKEASLKWICKKPK
jgi:hypothetical protein